MNTCSVHIVFYSLAHSSCRRPKWRIGIWYLSYYIGTYLYLILIVWVSYIIYTAYAYHYNAIIVVVVVVIVKRIVKYSDNMPWKLITIARGRWTLLYSIHREHIYFFILRLSLVIDDIYKTILYSGRQPVVDLWALTNTFTAPTHSVLHLHFFTLRGNAKFEYVDAILNLCVPITITTLLCYVQVNK